MEQLRLERDHVHVYCFLILSSFIQFNRVVCMTKRQTCESVESVIHPSQQLLSPRLEIVSIYQLLLPLEGTRLQFISNNWNKRCHPSNPHYSGTVLATTLQSNMSSLWSHFTPVHLVICMQLKLKQRVYPST